ncbi:Soluble pyridine nucleotide transhydrogenase [Streptomyces fumanus]
MYPGCSARVPLWRVPHTTHQTDPMTETETLPYDVVVIGAGPVGENVADRTRAAGLTTAIVESELVGGECSYWACMPSKALLRPVIARADARRTPGLSRAVQGPLDAAAVLAHRDYYTSDWKDDGQVQWVESIGADLYRGQGRLAGERTVEVTGADGTRRVLTARHAVAVCTGTRAALPGLPGLADVRPWTSREATSAKSVPGRLIVVGGGVVAVEMATAWGALGSRVTLLVRGKGLLNRMEPFAGELVAEALTEAGADIRTGTSVASVTREHGTVVAVTDTGDRIEADEILFATGRAPRTDDLGLAAALHLRRVRLEGVAHVGDQRLACDGCPGDGDRPEGDGVQEGQTVPVEHGLQGQALTGPRPAVRLLGKALSAAPHARRAAGVVPLLRCANGRPPWNDGPEPSPRYWSASPS